MFLLSGTLYGHDSGHRFFECHVILEVCNFRRNPTIRIHPASHETGDGSAPHAYCTVQYQWDSSIINPAHPDLVNAKHNLLGLHDADILDAIRDSATDCGLRHPCRKKKTGQTGLTSALNMPMENEVYSSTKELRH